MPATKQAELAAALDRLEARYGKLVPSDDPVEAGVLALLALHAPKFSSVETRDRLRDAFVDWNEARVGDPWDFTMALEASADPQARAFARAAMRFLDSLQQTQQSMSFKTALAEAQPDLAAAVEKVKGAPPAARAVIVAVLDKSGAWHLSAEVSKVLQKLGIASRTTSADKTAKEIAEFAAPDDRLRAHYLLTRYATRDKDKDDPLALEGAGRKAAKPKAEGGAKAKSPKAKPKG